MAVSLDQYEITTFGGAANPILDRTYVFADDYSIKVTVSQYQTVRILTPIVKAISPQAYKGKGDPEQMGRVVYRAVGQTGAADGTIRVAHLFTDENSDNDTEMDLLAQSTPLDDEDTKIEGKNFTPSLGVQCRLLIEIQGGAVVTDYYVGGDECEIAKGSASLGQLDIETNPITGIDAEGGAVTDITTPITGDDVTIYKFFDKVRGPLAWIRSIDDGMGNKSLFFETLQAGTDLFFGPVRDFLVGGGGRTRLGSSQGVLVGYDTNENGVEITAVGGTGVPFIVKDAFTDYFFVTHTGDVVASPTPTSAGRAVGLWHLPTTNNAPTGAPTTYSGRTPVRVDSLNERLYAYVNGAYKYVQFSASAPPSGTVTSVGLSLPSELAITGSPVTSTGTLSATWVNQTTNKVFAAPNGSTGTPTFRALVAADIPSLPASQITSGLLPTARGGTAVSTVAQHKVFAGPSSGSATAPAFRLLVMSDMPAPNIAPIDDTFSPYTMTTAEDVILADATAGAITINLLSQAGITKPLTIKNVGSANNVTVVPDGAELIDGAGSYDLTPLLAHSPNNAVTILPDSNTGNWWALSSAYS